MFSAIIGIQFFHSLAGIQTGYLAAQSYSQF